MLPDARRAIVDLKQAVEEGSVEAAHKAAFVFAAVTARHVGKPIAITVSGGPRGSHEVVYRVVAVRWLQWSTRVPLGPVTAHLVRTYLDPRGHEVESDRKIVGRHPDHAVPELSSDFEAAPPFLDDFLLDQVAAEAEQVWSAFSSQQ